MCFADMFGDVTTALFGPPLSPPARKLGLSIISTDIPSHFDVCLLSSLTTDKSCFTVTLD